MLLRQGKYENLNIGFCYFCKTTRLVIAVLFTVKEEETAGADHHYLWSVYERLMGTTKCFASRNA